MFLYQEHECELSASDLGFQSIPTKQQDESGTKAAEDVGEQSPSRADPAGGFDADGFLLKPAEEGFDRLPGSGDGGRQERVGLIEVFLALVSLSLARSEGMAQEPAALSFVDPAPHHDSQGGHYN